MGNQNRNLFRLTRFILLKLPFLFRFLAKFRSQKRNKRLLIIKTDAIGDYILFRNFLEIVKKSEKYKDCQIDVVGNTSWKDIALKYDAGFVGEFYFIRPDPLYDAPSETLKLGWQLFKNNYNEVLMPSSTRTFITDGLAALTAAKQIIGFESDNEGINPRYKIKTDKFYTTKLTLPPSVFFEFDRTKFFFENVLNCNIPLNGPYIKVNADSRQGIVIVISAGVAKRCWQPEKFNDLIKRVLLHTSQPVYLEGSVIDIAFDDDLNQHLQSGRLVNLMGKTTLLQLIDLVGSSSLVIANETSVSHMAAATQTKSVCIVGGGHFNRFLPYPPGNPSGPICVFEKMECYNCNWLCKFTIGKNEPFPCIGNVSLDAVWQQVQLFIK